MEENFYKEKMTWDQFMERFYHYLAVTGVIADLVKKRRYRVYGYGER